MITIRKAEAQDAVHLQHIYKKCFLLAAWQIRELATIPDFKSVSAGEMIWVVTDMQGQPGALLAVQEGSAYIHHLYVLPEHQGKGWGRALLQHLQTYLPFPWQLKCVANNHAALYFYQHLGWYEIEQGQGEDGSYYLLEHAGPL